MKHKHNNQTTKSLGIAMAVLLASLGAIERTFAADGYPPQYQVTNRSLPKTPSRKKRTFRPISPLAYGQYRSPAPTVAAPVVRPQTQTASTQTAYPALPLPLPRSRPEPPATPVAYQPEPAQPFYEANPPMPQQGYYPYPSPPATETTTAAPTYQDATIPSPEYVTSPPVEKPKVEPKPKPKPAAKTSSKSSSSSKKSWSRSSYSRGRSSGCRT